jgi:valyl-tRNA synthetase
MFKEQISIMNECYFKPNDKLIDQEATGVIEKLLPIIGKIRELRIKHNIKKTNIININLIDKILVKHSKFIQDFLNNYKI